MIDIINKILYYSNNIKLLDNKFNINHIKILRLLASNDFNIEFIINDKDFKSIDNVVQILKDFFSLKVSPINNDIINSKSLEIKEEFVDFLVKYYIKKRVFYLYIYILLTNKNTINKDIKVNIASLNQIKDEIKDPRNKEIINDTIEKLKLSEVQNKRQADEYRNFAFKILPSIINMEST
jgi:hypothetical protein